MDQWCIDWLCGGEAPELIENEINPRGGTTASGYLAVTSDVTCTPEVILVAPSQTVWNVTWASIDEVSTCDESDASVDGVDLDTRLGDDPNDILPHVWFTAPEELTDLWSPDDWPFDDPAALWIYMRVGYDPTRTDVLRCHPDQDPTDGSLGHHDYDTVAISAIQPYVAYRIKGIEEGVAGDGMTSTVVRIWVGLMHHFSFFYPVGGVVPPYSTNDLPSAVWDSTTNSVTARGTLARWWLNLTESTSTVLQWDDPLLGPTDSKVSYPCDPVDHLGWGVYGTAYEGAENDASPGLPASSLCFSDPAGDAASAATMRNFLGHGAWGEACVTMATESWSRDEAAKAAFVALFGESVFVEFSVGFFGTPAVYYDVGEHAHKVTRRVCLSRDDVQAETSVHNTLLRLRSTREGVWVFREFDYTQMRTAALEPAVDGACAC